MANATWWLFQNVVITTALVALIVVVCRATRIGPVAKHALWVLVLVKFVTPPLVVWPWAAPDPLGIAAIETTAGDRPASFLSAGWPATVASVRAGMDDTITAGWGSPDSPERAGPAGTPARVLLWLLAIWIAGSLCLLAIEGVRLARLAGRIRSSGRDVPPDPTLTKRVAALSARLGIRPLPVVMVTGIPSPAVWGFGRPRLLWPADLAADASEACVDGLIVHELAHVRRGDHIVGWIELAAGVVWWWNPIFWYVRSALREQAELSCDAWVISALPNGRRAYAESLLALSGAALRGASPMAVVGARATSRRMLERRLVMIMKGRAPLRLPIVGFCSLALVAAVTLPAWAASQEPPPPPPPPPAPAARPTPPAPAVMQAPPVPVPPPAPPAARVSRVPVLPQTRPTPPTPPVPRTVTVKPVIASQRLAVRVSDSGNLPAEGQQLLEAFNKDSEAIRIEAEQKLEARRAAAVKALEALQDQMAKAGKLDEAVAIRDYLRAGGPGGNLRYVIKK